MKYNPFYLDDQYDVLKSTWIRKCGNTMTMEKDEIVSVSHVNGAFMFTCTCKADLCNGHWNASINGTENCYPARDARRRQFENS